MPKKLNEKKLLERLLLFRDAMPCAVHHIERSYHVIRWLFVIKILDDFIFRLNLSYKLGFKHN